MCKSRGLGNTGGRGGGRTSYYSHVYNSHLTLLQYRFYERWAQRGDWTAELVLVPEQWRNRIGLFPAAEVSFAGSLGSLDHGMT